MRVRGLASLVALALAALGGLLSRPGIWQGVGGPVRDGYCSSVLIEWLPPQCPKSGLMFNVLHMTHRSIGESQLLRPLAFDVLIYNHLWVSSTPLSVAPRRASPVVCVRSLNGARQHT